jgi:hypothetical protein
MECIKNVYGWMGHYIRQGQLVGDREKCRGVIVKSAEGRGEVSGL